MKIETHTLSYIVDHSDLHIGAVPFFHSNHLYFQKQPCMLPLSLCLCRFFLCALHWINWNCFFLCVVCCGIGLVSLNPCLRCIFYQPTHPHIYYTYNIPHARSHPRIRKRICYRGFIAKLPLGMNRMQSRETVNCIAMGKGTILQTDCDILSQ